MKTKLETYINSLSRMINIPTISYSNSFDKKIFDEFHQLLKELFPHIFKKFKYEEFNGSILLSYLTQSKEDPILLMSHHDVVPVEDNWDFEPFNASVHDGRLYGRGTLDTKGNLWAILTSIEELLEEGFEFTRSIYIESSCNEETSGKGALEISRELAKRNIHFDFTLDEGGMIVYEPIDGAKGNFAMIALGEKDYMDIKFIAKSKGGHSSTPDKNNPLIRLSKFIVYVEKHRFFKPHLEETTLEMFSKLSTKMDGALANIFKHSKGLKHLLSKIMETNSPLTNSMVSSTLCFCKAKGSEGFNIIPEIAYVTANFRIAHHDSKDKIIEKFTKIANKFNIELEIVDKGYHSPICNFKNPQYQFLTKVIEDNLKDVICAPYISTGASDSKYFSDLSENNFRFAPIFTTNEQLDTTHAKNENIFISSLEPAVNFYKDLLKRL